MLSVDMLNQITNSTSYAGRKKGYADFVNNYMATCSELAKPHIQALCLSQLLVESGYFRYTSEIWGPTAAQRSYEGRRDLGNVNAGDGYKYRGRGGIQTTGHHNYWAVTKWIRENIDPNAPDFEKFPDLLASEEWFGATVMWYFDDRVPIAYLEAGDVEMVSAYVNNGGHRNRRINHLGERYEAYTWAALVYLGYGRNDVARFQKDNNLIADGIAGAKTRAKLHDKLVELSMVEKIDTPNALTVMLGAFLGFMKGKS